MEIIKVTPSGYCKGVIKAILKVKETLKKYPDKQIYILGMLVHNRFVVQALEQYHIVTLNDPKKSKKELIDTIDQGVIIFTAHGISPALKQYAQDKGLITVDATCDDVTKNMELCNHYLNKGFDIIYIGKNNHPESDAVLSLNTKIHLITDLNDIEKLNINNDKILITNQTTMSILNIKFLIEEIQNKYPTAILSEEICDATKQRQMAVCNLNNVDCIIVVGDVTSNNTTQLANIASENKIKTVIKIEKAKDLADYDFSNYNKIAVTGGASTPSYLTNNIIKYLKTNEKKYFEIEINKILDF